MKELKCPQCGNKLIKVNNLYWCKECDVVVKMYSDGVSKIFSRDKVL